jgi:5-methylcytosine-specific restriction protein A
MPARPKRACRHLGCPALVETGYCDAHASEAKEYKQQRERYRGTPASRGYDHLWRSVREQALKRDHYMCRDCWDRGEVTPAKDVDHIVPFDGLDDPKRLDLDNLRSLCRSCHNVKTAAQQQRL